MGFQINTNTAANTAYRNLSNTQNDISKSLEKLSSGLRINRAADDAAGLSIAEGLRSQVNGLGVAARNAQDGISVVQTAEGNLTEVHSILQRVRDLAVQAGNDSNNGKAREAIQTEVNSLADELTRIGDSTNFNGIPLLNRAEGNDTLTFQVGAGSVAANDQITVKLVDVTAIARAIGGTVTPGTAAIPGTTGTPESTDADGNVTPAVDGTPGTAAGQPTRAGGLDLVQATPAAGTTAGAARLAAIATIDTQIENVSKARSDLGAVQNRFESAINSINVSQENLNAAQSRIRDTDMAKEMADFTRSNILSQAGTAMLSQANQMNQGVLQLLR
ncbi:flagellin [Arthrobacter sp. RIT-PI-e]|uniref:flagellin N-terminal helical domain-containing protein n=1 Tax=Arthrobacter sp. RIT-PI-e TaxID=1681197 RepID=UPI0006764A98|nr:flagellin [Arthrobacter sp. RIT-PI-e]KNC20028.1 flagellin [Arthrobacter sp. RIT-PI-e]